jgi:hypothetical protein
MLSASANSDGTQPPGGLLLVAFGYGSAVMGLYVPGLHRTRAPMSGYLLRLTGFADLSFNPLGASAGSLEESAMEAEGLASISLISLKTAPC